MALPNLTRDQAAARAAAIDVEHYAITLDLTNDDGGPSEETFHSSTTVTFTAQPGTSTVIDIAARTVRRVELNGTELDVSGYDEEQGITLPGLAATNTVVVEADCEYSHTGEGLHRFVDPVDDEVYLYSQFETADAKRMFACFDQPDLKAAFDVTVTAPAHWQVISNGAPLSVADGVHTFATTPKMSTYLVALIAGPYARWNDEYSDEHGTIDLGIYCRASLSEFMDADRLFTETKQGFGFYHKNFGTPYAFGKYDQLFVPEFNAGAMENAGAVTFLEDYVFRSKVTKYSYERRAETVLHEMAHMWFGDLVTMRWWDDLWLNESFATFASVLCQAEATEYTEAWTTFANVEKSWAYRQDQLPSTHPVAADIPDLAAVEVNFDGITYAKGASVLKQLVAYVGLENFLAGLRSYFRDHAFGNATFDDLLGALETASGRDLSDWGSQWLKTTGLNTLSPDFEVDDEGKFTRFAVKQSGAAPGAGETRVHRLAVGIYDDAGAADSATSGASGKLVRIHREELDVEGPLTDVPALVGVSRGKLVLVNDDDLTYCSLRLDDESLETLLTRIADIAEPLPRTLAWSAAWEMTREAELRARDFVALVSSGVHAESEVGVAQRLLLQAQTALSSYAEPAWASEHGWPAFADRLLELARAAEPGSDHQLAFVNALTGSVLSAGHTVVLQALLDSDPASLDLPGLTVDTDLRWRIVNALAASGALEPDASVFIDTELERDQTAAGKRQAAQARAARPVAEVKEAAWKQVIEDDSLPNITARSVIAGIVQPGQAELLAPFSGRYFDVIEDVWARRSSEVAQTVVIGLYPSWDISPEALGLADAFLAKEIPSALRRLVSEGRAGIVRSLRAREFDAGS
ncbi:aminopeptidase N [Mycobacteroides abscessus subsp. massiliense]|uniref:aminopeptidase N n=1 Tax=Mycobacteroides abscessus TaxID=36809 RepID=UPI0009A8CA2F|nr:aminopeptidase N [Mycobacteroides abscessus]SKF93801.1 aminopeptidase N [Mycobacteroides abscessus subsp. massiliense]SKH13403.1 aminopeptidase N [Mycobacteroides abscessus subsp. massiliense]SKJ40064.1 aminopeptidase N [Mycobacteroides abscessus subsp. massiliense]SKJ76497.1 aminopeptidase N [Mycobacteroides abscessus subsp. massiliense]SKL03411.1 aminopeptidase N [Mycobacteroides abscessus subsp. massiliense]